MKHKTPKAINITGKQEPEMFLLIEDFMDGQLCRPSATQAVATLIRIGHEKWKTDQDAKE